jgi:hypothetical protein
MLPGGSWPRQKKTAACVFRRGAAVVAVRAGGLAALLWDTVERAGEIDRVGRARCNGGRRMANRRVGRANTRKNTKGRTITQSKTRTITRTRQTMGLRGRAVEGAVAGRGTPPVGPRPSLMTTVFAGLGGGEGVGASIRGSIAAAWPEGGGGPPDAGIRDAAAWWPPSSSFISSRALAHTKI